MSEKKRTQRVRRRWELEKLKAEKKDTEELLTAKEAEINYKKEKDLQR